MNDQQLLQRIAAGDSNALTEFYEEHGLHLLRYLIGQVSDSALAEELLQDVMLSVWQSAKRFRGDSSPRTWLFSIARHHALNARKKRSPPTLPLYDEGMATHPPPTDIALRQIVRSLPDNQHETLELVFYHGLTGQEAADVLGVPLGTVKSRLHRAKAALRELFEREYHG